MFTMMKPRHLILIGMIFGVALLRLIPHPWNFSPVAALALFGGAHFHKRVSAFAVPLAALFISDLFIGFYSTLPVVYGSFALVVIIGMALGKRKSPLHIMGAAGLSSVLFFVLTNVGTWALTPLYPKSLAGLQQCFTLAIPFFQNTVLGDQFFTAFLFGTLYMIEKRFVFLREPAIV